MYKNAYAILRKLELNTPEVFTIDEAIEHKHYLTFYARYSKDADRQSGIIKQSELLRDKLILEKDFASGKLLSIEAAYNTIFSGASLTKEGFTYSEIVEGHLVSLLRRGLCGIRLIHSNKIECTLSVFQGWNATQFNGYHYEPLRELTDTKNILNLIEPLVKNLYKKQPHVLLEWLYTDKGLIFCDARDLGFEDFGSDLHRLTIPNHGHINVFGKNIERKSNVKVDGFDIDYSINNCSNLHAYNGALLSHYVTRDLSKKEQIKLLV